MIVSAIISALSSLIPGVIGLIFWKLINPILKLIVIYSLFSFLSDVVGITLAIKGHNNAPVVSLFAIGQVAILGGYFGRYITGQMFKGWFGIAIAVIVLAFVFYCFIFNDPTNYMIALRILGLANILIVTLCIISYYYLLERLSSPRLERDPNFWILSGLLLQMSSSAILAFAPDLVGSIAFKTLWGFFKNLMQVLTNIVFGLAISLGCKLMNNE